MTKVCSTQPSPGNRIRQQAKPLWVKLEIIKLKALMADDGCRKVADAFNRVHARQEVSVGKTFVNNCIRNHNYEIQILRRKIKNQPPKPVTKNLIWGMDLTGKGDNAGNIHQILGIVEHHSRKALTLEAIRDKSSITLIRYLLNAIEQYGKPEIIRTDNEAVFQSRIFKFVLRVFNIKHQSSEVACPWQNGRIERLFGTLKNKLIESLFLILKT